ncbi:sensor histidine kinase [Cupriavidus campinensis]
MRRSFRPPARSNDDVPPLAHAPSPHWAMAALCLLSTVSVVILGRALLGSVARLPRSGAHGANGLDPDYASLMRSSRLSSMGELAGSLAHELNQPLTAIVSNAQAARQYLEADVVDVAEVREILKDVADEACRASATVRQIRALIKGESPVLVPTDIGNAIDQAIALVRGNALGRGIVLSRQVASPLPRVNGDAVQIQQLLLNLLLNACDAVDRGVPGSGEPREVTVLAHAEHGMVRIAVRDTGAGVPPSELADIFEPFVTSKPQGMGLGLSISRAIAARHGGTLEAWNNAGRGMTFQFSLPQEGMPTRRAARMPWRGAAAAQ